MSHWEIEYTPESTMKGTGKLIHVVGSGLWSKTITHYYEYSTASVDPVDGHMLPRGDAILISDGTRKRKNVAYWLNCTEFLPNYVVAALRRVTMDSELVLRERINK